MNKNEYEQSESEEDKAHVRMTHKTALHQVDGFLQYLEERRCTSGRKINDEKNKI